MHPLDPDRDPNVQGRVRIQIKNEDGSPINPNLCTSMFLIFYVNY